jgi:predicted DNA-binding protein
VQQQVMKVRGVSAEKKTRLAALAKERYGRASAGLFVRHLIDEALEAEAQPLAAAGDAAHVVQLPAVPKFAAQPGRKTPVSRIELRLQLGERQALNNLADAEGVTPQAYLISLLRTHLTARPEMLGNEIEALRQSTYQLAHLGTNLNQVAKALNAGHRKTVEQKMIEQLSAQTKDQVKLMRALIESSAARWDVVESGI